MEQHTLTLIVPIYNERDSLEMTLQHLRDIKKQPDFNVKIVLVNDGSQDGTERLLEDLSDSDFLVIHHHVNRGYGAALKTGIRASTSEFIAITDADETYPNERLPEFFDDMTKKHLDMLVGARTGESVKIPLIRKPAKWTLNMIANYLANTKIPDLNSGFRVMRKSVVEKFLNILPNGFSFTTTITLAMLTNGYNVEYLPINYHQRGGKSKIRPIYDTLNFLQLIIRTILYFDPLKIFLPLSVIFLSGSLVMVGYRFFMERAFGVTSIIFFVCGIQLLGLGMLADLIDKRIELHNTTHTQIRK